MINAARVAEMFEDSLFGEAEVLQFDDGSSKGGLIPAGVSVSGIINNVIFNPEKLKNHHDEITSLLLELPEPFMESKGGGWSFLQACEDKNGVHWGEHPSMEQLFMLGMAIEKVTCLLPRDMWKALPGGMPYYVVKD